ncbi:KH domain-containing, RNA-binding, signal transduction-associated protein 3 [Nymphon striatum]|nr:KH domain-containing, RNA-binding, signal transduction-associated protein 3 [Nymphon striatum]
METIKTDRSTPQFIDVSKPKPIKLQMKVVVPVKEHPNFNFVGKLLGPKGLSLKRLQEETMTKMAILGKGSMRDKAKESELREGGDPKYSHLNDELHVDISAYAPAPEAYARMANALEGIKKFLVPDYYDDIRSQQLQELAIMNGGEKMMRGGMKGGAPPIAARPPRSSMQQDQSQWVSLAAPPPQRTMRGRGRGGPQVGRGSPRGSMRGGRGGAPSTPRPAPPQFLIIFTISLFLLSFSDSFYDYSHDESYQEAGDYSQDYTGMNYILFELDTYPLHTTTLVRDNIKLRYALFHLHFIIHDILAASWIGLSFDFNHYYRLFLEDWNPNDSTPRMKSESSGAGGPIRRGGMSRGGFRNQPYPAQSFGASRIFMNVYLCNLLFDFISKFINSNILQDANSVLIISKTKLKYCIKYMLQQMPPSFEGVLCCTRKYFRSRYLQGRFLQHY